MGFLDDLTSDGFIDKLAAGNRVGAIGLLLGEKTDPVPPDWRVRLSIAPRAEYLYHDEGNQIMKVLDEKRGGTGGVIWPYTPDVTMSYNANYDSKPPTHSNYPIHTYKSSAVSTISVTGDFTAQTPQEAEYLLASLIFLRASTKMFWGKDDNAGQPPPVLYLNGYGAYFFPNVPVVVTSYTANLPQDVDYIEALVLNGAESDSDNRKQQVADALTRIPSSVTMSVTLEPVYSRAKVADEFTFEKFARGQLIGGDPSGTNRGGGGFV